MLTDDFLVRLRQAAKTPAPSASDMNELADTLDSEDWWTLHAHVEAFGSTEVRDAFDEILTKRARLRTAIHAWNELRELPPDARPEGREVRGELDERREEVSTASRELLDTLNSELGGRR